MKKNNLLLYSFGSTSFNLLNFYFANKIAFFYDAKVGDPIISLALVTLFLSFSRGFDAITDPYIGLKNDWLKSQGKSNVIFYLVGIPLTCFSFWWIWHPPIGLLGKGLALNIWFFVTINTYFIAYTLVAIPYDAYLVDLAQEKNERVDASSLKALFGILGLLGGVYWIGHANVPTSSSALTLMALACFLLALLGIGFKPKKLNGKTLSIDFKKIKGLFIQKDIRFFWGFVLGVEIVGALFIKYLEYYVHHILNPNTGKAKAELISILYGIFILATLLGMFIWNQLGKKRDTIKCLKLATLSLIAILPNYYWVGSAGGSWLLVQTGLFFAAVGLCYSALPMLTVVEIAKLGDRHFLQAKEQVDALYFGIYALIRKLALAGGLICLTALTELFEAFDKMLLGYALIGPLMGLILLMAWYGIDRYSKTIQVEMK